MQQRGQCWPLLAATALSFLYIATIQTPLRLQIPVSQRSAGCSRFAAAHKGLRTHGMARVRWGEMPQLQHWRRQPNLEKKESGFGRTWRIAHLVPKVSEDEQRNIVMEEWKDKRAREIKAELKRLNIPSSDCFEKRDLLDRLVEGIAKISRGEDPSGGRGEKPRPSAAAAAAAAASQEAPQEEQQQRSGWFSGWGRKSKNDKKASNTPPADQVIDVSSNVEIDYGSNTAARPWSENSNDDNVVYVDSVVVDTPEQTAKGTASTASASSSSSSAGEGQRQQQQQQQRTSSSAASSGGFASQTATKERETPKAKPPPPVETMKGKTGFIAEADLLALSGAEAAANLGRNAKDWRSNDMLTVDLNLPNGLEGKFLVDTGSPHSMIDQSFVKKLGTHAQTDPRAVFEQGYQIVIDQAMVGETPVGELSALVFNSGEEPLPLRVPGIHGVLGLDFLNRFDFDLNFRDKKLSLFDQGMLLRHNPTVPGGRLVDIPVAAAPSEVLLTEVRIFQDAKESSVTIPAVIDTGTSYSTLNWAAASLIGADKEGNGGVRLDGAVMAGVDGKPSTVAEVPVGVRFPSLAPKGHSMTQRLATVADLPIFADLGFKGDTPAMVLGMDVLADNPWSNRLSFSVAMQRMRVSSP